MHQDGVAPRQYSHHDCLSLPVQKFGSERELGARCIRVTHDLHSEKQSSLRRVRTSKHNARGLSHDIVAPSAPRTQEYYRGEHDGHNVQLK